VGAVWSVTVVPLDELLEAGEALLAAVEDFEVEALAKRGLDPAFGLAVGLRVGTGAAVAEPGHAAHPAPRRRPVRTAVVGEDAVNGNALLAVPAHRAD
jgi:hypothetical protein